jgi:ubiquinone/menaquinone biosynthesis C-methylase UbiE/uncharacterized protein YbaR (Trm112 family)
MKSRIYEKLSTETEPLNYSGKIPWIVQQQVAATNGIHYLNSIGLLKEYPIPEIPVDPDGKNNLLLDIGCGWGRWLTAAAAKNFIPVGIDIRLEFCEVARKVVQQNGGNAYTVVADLQQLPFQNDVFDLVWSFSVIQHTHYNRLTSCLHEIRRILKEQGYCFLEFPNKNGIRNYFGPASSPNNMDFESWDVRYYSPFEYKKIFENYFDNFSYSIHSALGIGILPGDIKYARGLKNKTVISVSRGLTLMAGLIKPLQAWADSIYIKAEKNGNQDLLPGYIDTFLHSHLENPENNLNIIPLLACPKSGYPLVLSDDHTELICQKAAIAYPIHDSIPILVTSEARSI